MATVHGQVRTSRSPEEVWRMLADFSHAATWDPGVSRATRHASGPPTEGDTYTVWIRMGWIALPMSYRTLVLQPHERILFEGVGGTIRALDDLRVTADAGITTVTWRADITLRGPLGLFDRLLQPVIGQVADDAMEGLQAWLGPVSSG